MEWMAEILFLFNVCLCVCAQRTGQSDQFKMVKATDFKFDVHVPRHSPDMTAEKFFKMGRAKVNWPPNFWALNANSSKTVKATDLDLTCMFPGTVQTQPLKNFSKERGQGVKC